MQKVNTDHACMHAQQVKYHNLVNVGFHHVIAIFMMLVRGRCHIDNTCSSGLDFPYVSCKNTCSVVSLHFQLLHMPVFCSNVCFFMGKDHIYDGYETKKPF